MHQRRKERGVEKPRAIDVSLIDAGESPPRLRSAWDATIWLRKCLNDLPVIEETALLSVWRLAVRRLANSHSVTVGFASTAAIIAFTKHRRLYDMATPFMGFDIGTHGKSCYVREKYSTDLLNARSKIQTAATTTPNYPISPSFFLAMFLLRVHIDRYCETNVRASSYIIYVDLPGEDDVLLVHGYTGAYDLVSRSVAEFLQHREPPASAPLYGSWTAQHQRGDVLAPPSEEVIDTLRERGYLTELSQDQEQAVVGRIAEALHRKSLRGSLNFILMPTYDCNLRCGYCFQDYMRTNPSYSYLLEPMSRGMADRIFAAMDFLMKERGIDASQPRSIGLFGGEPLLARNRPIIEHIVSRAAETKSPLSAVTNATELAAYRDLLSPREIAQVQITLDGIPSEHDRRRIRADGGGTFEAIASNIDLALDRGVYVTIRVNVDRRNVAQLPAMACLFAEHGWIGSASFSAYVAPIRPANTNVVVGDTFDNWDLSEALRRLSANHPEVAIFDTQDRELEDTALRIFQGQPGAMPPMKESYCGAHTGMFVFDPKGDVYACWERTGDSRIRVGRVTEDGRVETESTQFQLWRSRTVASNPVCNKCRYSFHCGGGCAVLAFGRSGEYHTNFCDGFAARFRANAAKAFLKHKAGEISRPQIARLCSE